MIENIARTLTRVARVAPPFTAEPVAASGTHRAQKKGGLAALPVAFPRAWRNVAPAHPFACRGITRTRHRAGTARPLASFTAMIRITITPASFEAIAATLPSSVGVEDNRAPNGDRYIWLDPNYVDGLRAIRKPGESYSDVILRVARG